jgi:hypothetical protein
MLSPNKHFEYVKETNNFFHLRLDIPCVYTKFHEKPAFLLACVKQKKEISRKQPFLTQILSS